MASLNCFCLFLCIALTINVGIAARNLGALPQGLPPMPDLPFFPDLEDLKLPPRLANLPEPSFLQSTVPTTKSAPAAVQQPMSLRSTAAMPQKASGEYSTGPAIGRPAPSAGSGSIAISRNLGALPFGEGLPPLPDLPFDFPMFPRPDPSKFGLPPLPDLLNPFDLPNPFERFTKHSSESSSTGSSSEAASSRQSTTSQMSNPGAGSTTNARNLGALPFGEGLPPLSDLPFPFPFPDGEMPHLPRPDLSKFGLPPLPDLLNPFDLPNPFEQFRKHSSESSSSSSSSGVASSGQSATSQMSTPGARSTVNARNLGALPFGEGLPPLPDLPFPFPVPEGGLPKPDLSRFGVPDFSNLFYLPKQLASGGSSSSSAATNSRNLGALPFGEGLPPLPELPFPFPDLPKPDLSRFGLPPLPDFPNIFDLPNPLRQLSEGSSQSTPSGSSSTSATSGRYLFESSPMKMSSKLSSIPQPQPRNLLNFPQLPEFHFPHFPNIFHFPKSSPSPFASPKSAPSTQQKASPPQHSQAMNQPMQVPSNKSSNGMPNANPSTLPAQRPIPNQQPNGGGNPGIPNRNPSSNPQQQQRPLGNQVAPNGAGNGGMPNRNPGIQQQQQPMNQPSNQMGPQQRPMGDHPMPIRMSTNYAQQQAMDMGSNRMVDHAMPIRPISQGSYRVGNSGSQGLMTK